MEKGIKEQEVSFLCCGKIPLRINNLFKCLKCGKIVAEQIQDFKYIVEVRIPPSPMFLPASGVDHKIESSAKVEILRLQSINGPDRIYKITKKPISKLIPYSSENEDKKSK